MDAATQAMGWQHPAVSSQTPGSGLTLVVASVAARAYGLCIDN
jgi:hypothetical protein